MRSWAESRPVLGDAEAGKNGRAMLALLHSGERFMAELREFFKRTKGGV